MSDGGIFQCKLHAVVFDAVFNYKLTINLKDIKNATDTVP
jgi:hypothetical protein